MRIRGKDYDSFKTGLSYQEIYELLRNECINGKRKHVTRHTVLGKWFEIKQSMYRQILEEYGINHEQ